MFNHYLTIALRNFRRHKTSTAIGVLGLSLGLACFIAGLGAATYLKSADSRLVNADRVVAIMERRTSKQDSFDTGFVQHSSEALVQAMHKEFPQLPAITRIDDFGAYPTLANEHTAIVGYQAADRDYLRVLNWPRLHSSAANPLDVPLSVVLGEGAARQLFGATNVVGRTLRLQNALDVTVSAVLSTPPQPSHIGTAAASVYDIGILMTSDTRAALQKATTGREPPARPLNVQWSFSMGSFTYALLPQDNVLSAGMLESRLAGIAERNGAGSDWQHEFRVKPLSAAWLASLELNFLPFGSGISIPTTLLLMTCLVLGIACANYANLAFAQAAQRAKETGVRRAIGATRPQLVLQAVAESLCHVAVANCIALAIVVTAGSILENRTGIDAFGTVTQSVRFWSVAIAAALLVSIAIALYPAFALSRIHPSQVLRAGNAASGRSRGVRLFIGLQFAITGALLVVLLVVQQQNSYTRGTALIPNTDPQVFLGAKWGFGGAGFATWKSELQSHPAIKAVSATSNRPWTGDFGYYPFVLVGPDGQVSPVSTAVHYDFEKVLKLNIIAGRSFDRSFNDVELFAKGPPSILIDETLARHLGFENTQRAVGQLIPRTGSDRSVYEPAKIIGVVQDQPLRLLPFLDRTGTAYQLFPRFASTPIVLIDRTRVAEALTAIDSTWKKLNPAEPIDREFVDDSFERAYAIYNRIGKLLTAITAVAFLIALLGGFSFANFIASRRAHEIGIRKTLGARTKQIIAMLLRDFSKPVLIANLVVWPLAYFAAQKYLAMFVQRIELTWLPFALSLALTLLLAWAAVGRQAYRAAKVNPASVLRHE